jgi:Xaa-Pro aminopeptidase
MFDYPARRQRLLRLVLEKDAAAILVTDEINVRYLSGFSGDSSYLLLTEDRQVIISDSRYDTQIAAECPDLELVTRTAAQEMKILVRDTIRQLGKQAIAIESDSITKAGFDAIAAEASGVSFVDTTGLVLSLRAIKDSVEIGLNRRFSSCAGNCRPTGPNCTPPTGWKRSFDTWEGRAGRSTRLWRVAPERPCHTRERPNTNSVPKPRFCSIGA